MITLFQVAVIAHEATMPRDLYFGKQDIDHLSLLTVGKCSSLLYTECNRAFESSLNTSLSYRTTKCSCQIMQKQNRIRDYTNLIAH
jgi:hypothetical protein